MLILFSNTHGTYLVCNRFVKQPKIFKNLYCINRYKNLLLLRPKRVICVLLPLDYTLNLKCHEFSIREIDIT